MDFHLTKEQLLVRKMYREFAENEVKPLAAEIDEEERFPMETVEKMAKLGMMGIYFPKQYGGAGGDVLSYAMCVEELAKVCGTTAVIVSAHTSLCAAPIFENGTEEQKMKYLPDLCSGKKIGAFGLTEPGAGTDAQGQQTTAVLDESGENYILNGSKCFITNGGIADLYCVFASTDPSQGVKGISCFLVERSRPGVSIGKIENKLGIRLSNTAEVIFEDVRVPKDHLVGELNKGFKIAMNTLDISRLNVGAMGVGLAMRCLEEAITYAKTRVQFGKPIAKLGAIQTKIADMGMDVESTNQLVLYAAELMDAKQPFARISCMAKCRGADVANRAATEALQIFGGYGYMKDYPMEKMFRDAKILQIYEGTCEVQRQVIAGTYLR